MGVDMLLQAGFGCRHIGHVDRGADNAGIAQRDFGEGNGAGLASHHRKALGLKRPVLRASGSGEVALGLVESDLRGARGGDVGGTGRCQKGVVAPTERQGLVAQPDRDGQRVQDGAEIGGCCRRRGFFQPNRRHGTDGAAPRRQLASVGIAHRKLEGNRRGRKARPAQWRAPVHPLP